MKEYKKLCALVIHDIFYISLITYLVYFLLEFLKEGLISNYFDLNFLLVIAIISGVLSVFLSKYREGVETKPRPRKFKKLPLIIFYVIIITLVLLIKLKNLGWLGVLVSICGGMVFFIVFTQINTNKNTN